MSSAPKMNERVRRLSICCNNPKDTGVSMESDIYNDTAVQQCEVVEFLLPFFERALKGVASVAEGKPNQSLYLADFGVSGGKACVPVVKTIQKMISTEETVLYLNDRKENNFDVTLCTIDEGLGDSVSPYCIPEDMYSKMDNIPAASLHCAWSTTALQWLSVVPSSFTTGTNAMQRLRSDPNRIKWASQARRDLFNFCLHRAREMAPGGVLVFSFPCLNSEDSPDQLRFADVVFSDAKNLLVQQGILESDDEKTLVIPEYYRSEREVLEVLDCKEMVDLWKVKDVDTVMMEDPWVDAWKRGQITRAECAKMQTVATRSYNDGIVRSKIRNNEKQEIFWNTLESLCENNPELASHRMRYICVALQRKSSDEGELSTAG